MSFMRTTLYGEDKRTLGPLMQKPSYTVAMSFADDPSPGLSTQKFTGSSVVFTPTVTFMPKTAALR
jgi:hypothetical protein